MKNVTKLKLATIFSFLAIIIPGDHVSPPNGIILFLNLFQSLWSIFSEEFNHEMYISAASSIVVCSSLVFVFLKNKLMNILGVIIQFTWIGYLFKKEDLNAIFYIVTILIYLLLVFTLIFKLFYSREKKST